MPPRLELNAQTVRFLEMLGLPLHRDPATSNGAGAGRGNGGRPFQLPPRVAPGDLLGYAGPPAAVGQPLAGVEDPNEIAID